MERTTCTFLDMETTWEEIYRIRDFHKMFVVSYRQLIIFNNVCFESGIRYKHSKVEAENRLFYSHNLHLKLYTIEAVRNIFHEYVYDKAIELRKMQMAFHSRTGIAWNDNLAEEIDNEGSAGEEQLQNS